jgi:hypothetical protein
LKSVSFGVKMYRDLRLSDIRQFLLASTPIYIITILPNTFLDSFAGLAETTRLVKAFHLSVRKK